MSYEIEPLRVETINKSIGVDLGIKELAILSDGTKIKNSTKLKRRESRLKRQQRKLARQVRGSNSRNRTKRYI